MTLEPTSKPEIEYTDCEISSGALRLLFAKDQLGVNVYRSAENIAGAINTASLTCPRPTANPGNLSFLALQSIKHDYCPCIFEIEYKIAACLGIPMITLNDNFDDNFSKLAAYKSSDYDFPRDWQETLGAITRDYFEGLAMYLHDEGFENDDLLKDGFNDAVFKHEISVMVVDKLSKEDRDFYECVVEDGGLYLRILPRYWGTEDKYVTKGLIDIL